MVEILVDALIVETLKMKYNLDLYLILWYDLKKLLCQEELNPRVRCAFGNVLNKNLMAESIVNDQPTSKTVTRSRSSEQQESIVSPRDNTGLQRLLEGGHIRDGHRNRNFLATLACKDY